MNEDILISTLRRQLARKALLYDGYNATRTLDDHFRSCVEELGEIATALQRERSYGAVAECYDLAHTALLLAKALDPTGLISLSLFQG